MARIKYLKCAQCGKKDEGRGGTATTMRCPDCGGVERVTAQGIRIGGAAQLCRDCCPSGHETR